jgi:hypothetical protein
LPAGTHPYFSDPLFLCFPEVFLREGSAFHFLAGASLVLGFLVGVKQLWLTKRKALVFFWLLSFIFLPRPFFSEILSIPIVYPRFAQPLLLLTICISALGLGTLFTSALGYAHLSVSRAALRGSSLACLGLITVPFFDFQFSAHVADSGYIEGMRQIDLQDAPAFQAAESVLEYLGSFTPIRLAAEVEFEHLGQLGSPRLFTILAHHQNLPHSLANGFLVESSVSGGFLDSALRPISLQHHRDWKGFQRANSHPKTVEQSLRQIEELGIEYIVAHSNKLKSNLSQTAQAVAVLNAEPFTLFRIPGSAPTVELLSHAPFLIVERGGLTAQELSQVWFELDLTNKPKLIWPMPSSFERRWSDNDISSLAVPKDLSGIIVTYPRGTILDSAQLQQLESLNAQLFIFGAYVSSQLRSDKLHIFQSANTKQTAHDALPWVLSQARNLESTVGEQGQIATKLQSDSLLISGSAGSTIIRFTGNRRLKLQLTPATGQAQKALLLFNASPSFLFAEMPGVPTTLSWE